MITGNFLLRIEFPKCPSLFPVSIGSYLNYKLQDLNQMKMGRKSHLFCYKKQKTKRRKFQQLRLFYSHVTVLKRE